MKAPNYFRHSSTTWIVIHVVFPLLPFFVEGFIRNIVYNKALSLPCLNSSTLIMSVGLLCLFVNQNLISNDEIIHSDENVRDIVVMARCFSKMAMCSFMLFGIIVFIHALLDTNSLEINNFIDCNTVNCIGINNPLRLNEIKASFEKVIFVLSLCIVLFSIYVQKSFKLKATI